MDEEEFLDSYPVEFGAFTDLLQRRRMDALENAARIETALYNINLNHEVRSEPYTIDEVLGRNKTPGFDARGPAFKQWVMDMEMGNAEPTLEDLKKTELFEIQFREAFKHQDELGKTMLVKE